MPRCQIEFCVTMDYEKMLNSVRAWLPGFSAMYHYTKFGMASMPPAQALLYRALQVRWVRSLFSITQEVEHPLISSATPTLPTPVVRVRSRSLLSTVTRMNPLNSSATRTMAIRSPCNSPPGEREVPVKGHPSPVGSIQPSALPLYSLLGSPYFFGRILR